MQLKSLWVKFEPPAEHGGWFDILFYDNVMGKGEPSKGRIDVDKGGAKITFMPVSGQKGWRFHDVTIHPQGADTDELELRWLVYPDMVVIQHSKAEIKRYYSYTISLEALDESNKGSGHFFYLDPQIVDTGGGTR